MYNKDVKHVGSLKPNMVLKDIHLQSWIRILQSVFIIQSFPTRQMTKKTFDHITEFKKPLYISIQSLVCNYLTKTHGFL